MFLLYELYKDKYLQLLHPYKTGDEMAQYVKLHFINRVDKLFVAEVENLFQAKIIKPFSDYYKFDETI